MAHHDPCPMPCLLRILMSPYCSTYSCPWAFAPAGFAAWDAFPYLLLAYLSSALVSGYPRFQEAFPDPGASFLFPTHLPVLCLSLYLLTHLPNKTEHPEDSPPARLPSCQQCQSNADAQETGVA